MAHNSPITEADMRTRVLIVAVAAVLGAGVFAVAQDSPLFSVTAENVATDTDAGRRTLSGGVTIMIEGVAVRADRAVIQNREVSLEGNVRLTIPSRFRVRSQF
jgi:lipopolysaccharide assembly outer membrane protein LptD (OstA)